MSKLPISVGNTEAQQRYIAVHKAFLLEFPELKRALEMVLTESGRKINEPPTHAGDVPQTQEEAARKTVFELERAAYDDFVELLLLAGNGLGLGATKVLRSIYERLVTAMHISKKPAEAEVFKNHAAIERGRIINRYKEVAPERLNEDFTQPELDEIQRQFAEANARHKAEYCKKCGKAKTPEAWTRENLDNMAKEVDQELFHAYNTCYLQPTMLIHATPTGLALRVRITADGAEYKLLSEPEAHGATQRGHFLALKMLSHLNNYFDLGQDSEVQSRIEAFKAVWS